MIDHQHGRIQLECDSCDTVTESDRDQEFAEFWAEAKRGGWKTRKIANEWVHSCPKCKVPT